MKLEHKSFFARLLITFVVIFFAVTKSILTYGLNYTADIFNFTVMSKSIWIGRPWYFENARGFGAYLHNNFIVPLMGPLTLLIGVYGIIIFVYIFLLWACIKLELIAESVDKHKSIWLRSILFCLILGPITFWIHDNPVYGFHPEVLYIPLATLYACYRLHNSNLAYLIAVLICLVRQDGAVILCVIEIFHQLTNHNLRNISSHYAVTIRNIVLCCFVCGVIFILGLFILQKFGSPGSERVHFAISQIQGLLDDLQFQNAVKKMLLQSGLLITVGLVLFLIIAPKITLISAIFILPVVIVTIISSFAYLPNLDVMMSHGVTWAPRAAMIWSLIPALGIFVVAKSSYIPSICEKRWSIFVTVILCTLTQLYFLTTKINYHIFSQVYNAYTGNLLLNFLSNREKKFLFCIANHIPSSTTVAVHGSLAAFFYSHDIVFTNSIHNSFNKPELILCESSNRLPWEYDCSKSFELFKLAPKTFTATVEGIRVASDYKYKNIIIGCVRKS